MYDIGEGTYLPLLIAVVNCSGKQIVLNSFENGHEIVRYLCDAKRRDIENVILLSKIVSWAPVRLRLGNHVEFLETLYQTLVTDELLNDIFKILTRKKNSECSEKVVIAYAILRILLQTFSALYRGSAHVRRTSPALVELLLTSVPISNIFHFQTTASIPKPFQVDLILSLVTFTLMTLNTTEDARQTLESIPPMILKTRCAKLWALVDEKHGAHVAWKPQINDTVSNLLKRIGELCPGAVEKYIGHVQ